MVTAVEQFHILLQCMYMAHCKSIWFERVVETEHEINDLLTTKPSLTSSVEQWYGGIDVSGVSQPIIATSEQGSGDIQLCHVVRGRAGLYGCEGMCGWCEGVGVCGWAGGTNYKTLHHSIVYKYMYIAKLLRYMHVGCIHKPIQYSACPMNYKSYHSVCLHVQLRSIIILAELPRVHFLQRESWLLIIQWNARALPEQSEWCSWQTYQQVCGCSRRGDESKQGVGWVR